MWKTAVSFLTDLITTAAYDACMEIFATLQSAYYIIGIIFMSFIFLLIVGIVVAALTIKSRMKRKADELLTAPRKGLAFWRTFLTTFRNSPY